jgi:hypothetical protein
MRPGWPTVPYTSADRSHRQLSIEKPTIQLDEEPAIMVRKPDATMQAAPQDIQLMSKHRVHSFKPQLRLGWRGQDGQSETEQPDHSASLGDSITSSNRIRFSVHTGAAPRSMPANRARATASPLSKAGVTGWRRSAGQDSGALRPEGHNRSRMLAITYRHFNGPCERRLVERL